MFPDVGSTTEPTPPHPGAGPPVRPVGTPCTGCPTTILLPRIGERVSVLPLQDRISLVLSQGARTARAVANDLRADIATVHRTLAGLEDAGILERLANSTPTLWTTAPGVEVEYRPGRIRVLAPSPTDPDDAVRNQDERPRCTAITSRGSRCKFPAKTNGRCGHHTA